MHESLKDIPSRILDVAIGALTQANQHAVYHDMESRRWAEISVLNAALAGELFLKAIIANEHPLLIFRDLFHLDDPGNKEMDIESIIEKGRTYNFEHLPKLLWVATGERLENLENFETLRKVRNSINHFFVNENNDYLRRLSLEFIYKNLDPLINKHFGLFAVEYHEDPTVGYDYVVECLISQELLFSIPDDFCVPEIDLKEELSKTSEDYQSKMTRRLSEKGFG